MKLSKKQIEIIRRNTPKALKGRFVRIDTTLGHFSQTYSSASYTAGYIKYGNRMQLVVTVYGKVV